MNLDLALRLTELLLGVAFMQQSIEHIASRAQRSLFMPRALLAVLLIAGIYTPWVCVALLVHAVFVLRRFQGPYNGGSDRMCLLILICLSAAHLLPLKWREYAFGYLALQLVLSYFMAGWVKIMNPEWRSGRALQDVFRFSAYPVSEDVRRWADRPRLLWLMSWAVMLFELLFPATLLTPPLLIAGLAIAALFHLANACLFGLNRFFWCWLAAYPSILWLQQRIFF